MNKSENPFWKEVFSSWNDYLDKLEAPKDSTTLRNEPLWNRNFLDKYYYDKQWYQVGINLMGDIIDDHEYIRSYQTLKRTFDINENFLTYANLVRIMPKKWKDLMKGTDCSSFTNHSCKSPLEALLSKTKKLWTKLFYQTLSSNNLTPTTQKKWYKKIRIDLDKWHEYYTLP